MNAFRRGPNVGHLLSPLDHGRSDSQPKGQIAFHRSDKQIDRALCLPFASLGSLAIQKEIDRIGKQE